MARQTIGNLVINVLLNARKLESGLRKMERRLSRSGRRIQNLGRNLTTGLSLPIAAAGLAATKAAVDFDDSMTKIVSLVGVSRRQVTAWQKDILALSGEVARAPLELAEGLFFVTSAGLRGQAALDVLRASAQAAAAGLGETAVVADAVTSAINAYGPANLSAAKATGVLVAAVREGKLSAEALAPVLGRIIPISASLGVGFDEVGAAMAVLSRQSGNASQSATQLRGILAKLIKPTEAAKKELKKVGLSMEDIRKSLVERGLLETLFSLRKAFEGNTEALGKIFEDVEALNGVLILTSGNAEKTRAIFAALATETGQSLSKAFLVASQSAGFKFRKAITLLRIEIIRLGADIVPVLLPILNALVSIVTQASAAFRTLTPETRKLIVAFAVMAAAMGPLIFVLGLFVSAVGALASPVVAATTAVVIAGVIMVRRWQLVKDSMITIWRQLGIEMLNATKNIIGPINAVFKAMKIGFKIIAAVSPLALGIVALAASDTAKTLREDLGTAFDSTKLKFDEMIARLTTGATAAQNKMLDLAEDSKRMAASMSASLNVAGTSGNTFGEGFKKTAGQVSSSAESLTTAMVSSMGSFAAQLANGKASMADFTEFIVTQIFQIITQLALLAVFGPLGGAFGAGFAGGFFKHGGRPEPGKVSVVGEGGPELFVPDTLGSITPLSELGFAGAGGMTINQTFIVKGVDLGSRPAAMRIMKALANEAKRKTAQAIEMTRRFQDISDANSRRAV